MDAIQQLARDAEIVAAVLGAGEDFTLIFLDSPIDNSVLSDATAKGWAFCGVVGLIAGQCRAKCEPDPDAALTMTHAACGFAQEVAHRLRPKQTGDAVKWLEQLHQLRDRRRDN